MNKQKFLEYLIKEHNYHNTELWKHAKANNYNNVYERHQASFDVYNKLIQDIENGKYDD